MDFLFDNCEEFINYLLIKESEISGAKFCLKSDFARLNKCYFLIYAYYLTCTLDEENAKLPSCIVNDTFTATRNGVVSDSLLSLGRDNYNEIEIIEKEYSDLPEEIDNLIKDVLKQSLMIDIWSLMNVTKDVPRYEKYQETKLKIQDLDILRFVLHKLV